MSAVPAPAVSVVVATYNRAPSLRLALESVRRQRFADWEAIVVGDGCTDDSAEVVAAIGDPRFRWHNLPVNHGSQWAPNNAGIALARGRWIAYLGHDDLWLPWHLGSLVERAEADRADFAHALAVYFSPEGIGGCMGEPWPDVPYAEHQFPPSSWLHRRGLVDEIGGWADVTTLDRWPDFDFSRRAALAGARFAFAPRLSMLKFPAPLFRGAYRNDAPLPQAPLLRLMAVDAEALEVSLLGQVARFTARMQGLLAAPSVREVLAAEGTPESVRRFQAERRGRRRDVGLDDPQPPPPAPAPSLQGAWLAPPGEDPAAPRALRLDCRHLDLATLVLLDGVPLAARVVSPTLAVAEVPPVLLAGRPSVTVTLLGRGGISAALPLCLA